MVASTRFPLKTVLVSASLSASIALLGCVNNNNLSSAPQKLSFPNELQQGATGLENPASQTQTPIAGDYRADWTQDRIIGGADFRTAAFTDSLRPDLTLDSPDSRIKSPQTSQGLENSFAKDLPGADQLESLPNTPAVIGQNAYFLTNSASSTNFFGLQDNGQIKWQLSLHDNGRFKGSSPAVGKAFTNTLYAITNTGRLYAVDANSGLVISFIDIPEEEFQFSSPWAMQDGTNTRDHVFLSSYKGRVYRFSFNGSTFTQDLNVKPVSSALSGKFSSSPIVTTNNVYVGSEEGKLYKLKRSDLTTVGSLDLSTTVRSEGCQTRAEMVIDSNQDVGIVPCGSYLYKVRLNDSSTSVGLSLAAQSSLLELRQLITLNQAQLLGPNHVNRPQIETTILRDPVPTDKTFGIEQKFGFQEKDFVRVESADGFIYGEIDTLTEDSLITLKGDGLFPLASPSPSPLLFGGEKVALSNLVVRPTPAPSASATPTPVPTPTPVGADPVTQFVIGNPEGLQAGDFIRFPTLTGKPVVQICSSTNSDCDKDATSKYPGLAKIKFAEEDADDELVTQVTLPGAALQTQIQAALAQTRFVPIEKVQNQVLGGAANSTLEFAVGSIKDFKVGDTVRVSHTDGSIYGRYEYGVIASITGSRIRLIAALLDAPADGDQIDIIRPNTQAFGRVVSSQKYSSGNILSAPVLRGNGQQVYVQHGNAIFELNYSSDASFKDSANYILLQSARLNQSNQELAALSRSRPLVVGTDKLLTLDTSIHGDSGIFVNRVLLPLNTNAEKLNDTFSIRTPNSKGELPVRAETQPVLLGNTGFVMFGGGNGVAYKLHKDVAW